MDPTISDDESVSKLLLYVGEHINFKINISLHITPLPPPPPHHREREGKEGNVLFHDALNTFYLRLYGIGHMVKDHLDSEMGYSFRLTARVLLYEKSHRGLAHTTAFFYTSRGALAGTRNSSKGEPHEESIRLPIAP